jgi:hypothetical protein
MAVKKVSNQVARQVAHQRCAELRFPLARFPPGFRPAQVRKKLHEPAWATVTS